ncbi:Uncharacterized protein FKW44_009559, partial [Caligus rogercresseyi]
LCRFCHDNRETTDHFLFDCFKLQEVYTETGEILRLQYNFYTPTRDHFIAFYTSQMEAVINAIITKTQQILYAKRSSNDYDISGVSNIINLHL